MYSKSGRKGRSTKMTTVSRSQALNARRNWMVPQVERGYSGAWGTTGELKAIDTSLLTTDVSTTEIITCINACSQGTDIGTRIGREIKMKSVQVKGAFYPNGANAGDLAFWAIVYDRQTNAAAPAWTDVYTDDGIYPEFRNLNNRKRFKVLGSGYIPLPKAGADVVRTPFEFYRKLNHPVEFNAVNGGAVADIQTGGLFWMLRGATAAGADDYAFQASARVRYSD